MCGRALRDRVGNCPFRLCGDSARPAGGSNSLGPRKTIICGHFLHLNGHPRIWVQGASRYITTKSSDSVIWWPSRAVASSGRDHSGCEHSLIEAPSSTRRIAAGSRETPRCTRRRRATSHGTIGMKVHIGVDSQTGMVHSVCTTSANVHDVTQAHRLLSRWRNASVGRSWLSGSW